jgi:hypothetical protein
MDIAWNGLRNVCHGFAIRRSVVEEAAFSRPEDSTIISAVMPERSGD